MAEGRKSPLPLLAMFVAAILAVTAMTIGAFDNEGTATMADTATQAHPYAGMWVTADGRIRHQLLPDGRYDEARGDRESAYRGQYWVTGNRIEYLDDTGFTADGEFRDDVLYHAGMVLRRE